MITFLRFRISVSALLLYLALVPSVLADGRLVPLDGSDQSIKPADFGYEIKIGRSGEDVMIHVLLNPEAAKKFSHANLKLTRSTSPAGRLEATLGLERDAEQGGRMGLIFRSGMVDDGELILWSEPFERQPAIGRFAGFRISIGTLLANAATDGAGSEPAEIEPASDQPESPRRFGDLRPAAESSEAARTNNSAVAEIEKQWELWKQTRGNGNAYRYVVQYACECAKIDYGSVTVEVEGDKAISARFTRTGKELSERGRELFLRTIDDLFGQLRKEADNGADRLTIIYHSNLGYPIYASVDPDPAAKDDEYELEVFLLSPWIRVPGVSPDLPARHLRGEDGAEQQQGTQDVRQALFLAIAEGRFDDVAKAVKAEPKLVDAEHEHGGTPLFWAAFHGHEKIAGQLLDQGAQVNARGIESATPLYEAAYRGHAGTVKLLLKYEANIEARNKSGHTPLYAAVSRQHEDVVRILLEAGANSNGPTAEAGRPFARGARSTGSASPLLLAVLSATWRTAETELTPEQKERAQERRQTMRRIAAALIVHPKARLDEPLLMALGQRAPLHMTVIAGDVELTRLLLEHGADPNIRDRAPPTRRPRPDGFTPLHHAAVAGNTELMDLLSQHGANPNIKNSLGQTSADLLREQALSQHRAKPNTKNSLGQTPADLLREQEVQKPENLPVGRWKIEFANGVVETCIIRREGTATVAEPKRSSAGWAVMKDGALVITFDDDRLERWTPVGRRMVVEHWYPAERFPSASPVLGIADRALTDDGTPGADSTSAGESRPKKDWPRELVQVIDELHERGAPPKSVDVRYADPDAENPDMEGGFYWRMRADKAAIDAHIKAFELKRICAKAKETARMFDRYPKDWPKPDFEKITWYAWPGNRDDTGISAHFWRIMVHDEKNGVLYFFHWIWDVGI
ncbi:MAG TPA: ankyrin repeat domain-containing protein [Pirellulaceae bacterium]|nr:ankyrin repeat domain-containing protein [Pirellulaceae bacterium]